MVFLGYIHTSLQGFQFGHVVHGLEGFVQPMAWLDWGG